MANLPLLPSISSPQASSGFRRISAPRLSLGNYTPTVQRAGGVSGSAGRLQPQKLSTGLLDALTVMKQSLDKGALSVKTIMDTTEKVQNEEDKKAIAEFVGGLTAEQNLLLASQAQNAQDAMVRRGELPQLLNEENYDRMWEAVGLSAGVSLVSKMGTNSKLFEVAVNENVAGPASDGAPPRSPGAFIEEELDKFLEGRPEGFRRGVIQSPEFQRHQREFTNKVLAETEKRQTDIILGNAATELSERMLKSPEELTASSIENRLSLLNGVASSRENKLVLLERTVRAVAEQDTKAATDLVATLEDVTVGNAKLSNPNTRDYLNKLEDMVYSVEARAKRNQQSKALDYKLAADDLSATLRVRISDDRASGDLESIESYLASAKELAQGEAPQVRLAMESLVREAYEVAESTTLQALQKERREQVNTLVAQRDEEGLRALIEDADTDPETVLAAQQAVNTFENFDRNALNTIHNYSQQSIATGAKKHVQEAWDNLSENEKRNIVGPFEMDLSSPPPGWGAEIDAEFTREMISQYTALINSAVQQYDFRDLQQRQAGIDFVLNGLKEAVFPEATEKDDPVEHLNTRKKELQDKEEKRQEALGKLTQMERAEYKTSTVKPFREALEERSFWSANPESKKIAERELAETRRKFLEFRRKFPDSAISVLEIPHVDATLALTEKLSDSTPTGVIELEDRISTWKASRRLGSIALQDSLEGMNTETLAKVRWHVGGYRSKNLQRLLQNIPVTQEEDTAETLVNLRNRVHIFSPEELREGEAAGLPVDIEDYVSAVQTYMFVDPELSLAENEERVRKVAGILGTEPEVVWAGQNALYRGTWIHPRNPEAGRLSQGFDLKELLKGN